MSHPGPRLSDRELEVLALVAAGWTNPQIARRLCLSVGTVRNHVMRICLKLGTENRTAAAVTGVQRGLVAPDMETPPA